MADSSSGEDATNLIPAEASKKSELESKLEVKFSKKNELKLPTEANAEGIEDTTIEQQQFTTDADDSGGGSDEGLEVSTNVSPSCCVITTPDIPPTINNPFARTQVQDLWSTDASSNKPIIAPSKLGAMYQDSGAVNKPSSLTGAVPKSVRSFCSSSKHFKLKPSVLGPLNNPFSKVSSSDEEPPPKRLAVEEAERAKPVKSPVSIPPKPPEQSVNFSINNPSKEINNFATPTFIFGKNLQSRIKGAGTENCENNAPTTNGERPCTGNLFSEAASELAKEDGVGWNSGGKTLVETSMEIAEKEKSQKRKFEEVEVVTGEEQESNVLQMNCKLYSWGQNSWQERGRGILRLNDWREEGTLHSRLVFRTQGTLMVMLNTKIWSEMTVEKASAKSVRFTASDTDGQPKIFLIMGSPKDVEFLYNILEWRVAAARSQNEQDRGKTVEDSKRLMMEESREKHILEDNLQTQ